MTGLYIHVPFCGSRCIYCDFYSTTMLWRREEYVEALCREMVARCTDDAVATIYLGGGTPSILGNDMLCRILECAMRNYNVQGDAEITLEANPDDVNDALLRGLPINRLSMGVQSLDDECLRFLRRRHTARQATEAIDTAIRCGITNISIDLIYGLPGQTMKGWQEDVACALALPITHLSAYALSYEPGTLLYKMRERGEVSEASDELSRDMYYHLLDATEAKGFVHYEISNFALPGCESRHNSSYWTGAPYLGFGPGAHSYDGKAVRRSNVVENASDGCKTNGNSTNFDAWLRGEYSEEHLSREDLFNERIFLSLRTMRGLDTEALKRDFAQEYAAIAPTLQQMKKDGRLVWRPPYLSLSRQCIFTSDDIISDLFIS